MNRHSRTSNASPPPPTGPRPNRSPRRTRAVLGVATAAALAAGVLSVPAIGAEAGPSAGEEEGPELIVNGDFAAGTEAWWWTPNTEGAVSEGRLCIDVPGGTVNPWDAIVGQGGIALEEGESYALRYTASSSAPTVSRANVMLAEEPYTKELATIDAVAGEPVSFEHVFTAGANYEAAQFSVELGGAAQPFTFCLEEVSLRGGAVPPVYEPDTGSPVRVNQVGYLTHGPKSGTVVTDAPEALPWVLRDAEGTQAATGETEPFGTDPTSGQHVHRFAFDAVQQEGEGWTVTVDGETSEPFAIGHTLYSGLRTDALAYYYHNRSGIEIDAELVGEEYARPAGHLNVAPNRGDFDVPCRPGVCDYRLDAPGGWYDAGDHGKYVVNGGISVAQVMSVYERTLWADAADGEALGDGSLRVPEHGNGVPDILDEARWQLDFLLAMQVPEGEELAGMAHHKLHDANWTGLPLLPHRDAELRQLHAPSTAATLNLAAAGAQAARLFEPYDPAFAAEALASAVTAYEAALRHPDHYADPNDAQGGGAYSDDDVTDEFYWAAAELFATTGEERYLKDLRDSPLHGDTDAVFPRGGLAWAATAGLGAITLATVDTALTTEERDGITATLLAAADGYAADAASEAYGVPFSQNYVWGSNSQVLNNMVVLGVAHDLTGEARYGAAVLHGLDYLLGRNPLNQSYITGYGERDSRNQHHRHWARQLNPALPHPAPGSVAGGPNEELQDPIAADLLEGCAPAMCYIDHIESYATNEITINWNAPLAWVASFVDDLGDGAGTVDAADRS